MAGVLAQEIAAQPEAVASFLDRQVGPARAIVGKLAPFSYVLVAARGSSDHAALYAQYAWGYLARLPVAGAAPSLHTIYNRPPRFADALVVGISQSGQSPDVVAVVADARKQGRPTIAVTNDPASPLGQAADHVIELGTTEQSIAATKTYTCQLAAMALLGALLSRDEANLEELRRLPAAMGLTLDAAMLAAERAAEELREATDLVILARGLNLCTAHEAALKLRELLRLHTYPFSAADFRHGSIALLDRGLPITMIMPSGATFDDMAALGRQLAAGGGRILAISDDDRARKDARFFLPMARVPEWLSPLVAVLSVQRLVLALAAARGLDPDNPRGLADKVVRTL